MSGIFEELIIDDKKDNQSKTCRNEQKHEVLGQANCEGVPAADPECHMACVDCFILRLDGSIHYSVVFLQGSFMGTGVLVSLSILNIQVKTSL